MPKTCFVVMPITDIEPYQSGHFKLVYDYIIKPACTKAGFEPIRADDIQETDTIVLSIIEYLLNADVAICDLSSKNPNVLYELGLRQAFNKPVTLIKDFITPRIFDVLGYRDIQYDENLRIDSVAKTIETLAKTLENDYEKGSNSLYKMLNVKIPNKNEEIIISEETELLLNSIYGINDKISRIEKSIINLPVSKHINEISKSYYNNIYNITIDLSNISTEFKETITFNYTDLTTLRVLLDNIFFQIEPHGIQGYTYEFDWIVFNESTKSEIHVIGFDKLKKFESFDDSRSLHMAGIYPFNELTVLKY